MNYNDDLTQFLLIISTITAEIKYGPFLMFDTEISQWNWTPTTYSIFLPHGIIYDCRSETNR